MIHALLRFSLRQRVLVVEDSDDVRELPGAERPHAHTSRAARAMATSSKGCLVVPMIW